MLISKPLDYRSSEITPRPVYISRRRILSGSAAPHAAAPALAHPQAWLKDRGYSKDQSDEDKIT
ncbi:MAG: hypothetical protein J4F97_04205, partial [Pseudomonadales bacterium]|nr:hypothetical protein [Pseudomonadales bacterium]